jgi:hypothetical protein
MQDEQSITQNLLDGGCSPEDAEVIVNLWRKGDLAQMKKRIAHCRLEQLNQLHESQKRIDRLDYLSYQMERS